MGRTKRPLVDDARDGLDALRRQIADELAAKHSYRDKFLSLARDQAQRSPQNATTDPPSDQNP